MNMCVWLCSATQEGYTYPHLCTCDLLEVNMRQTWAQFVSLPGFLPHPLKHIYMATNMKKRHYIGTACIASILYVYICVWELYNIYVFVFRMREENISIFILHILAYYIHYKQAQPPKTITELVANKICIKTTCVVYTYLCSRGSV